MFNFDTHIPVSYLERKRLKYNPMKASLSAIICLLFLASCVGSGKRKNKQKDNQMAANITNQYGYNRDFLKRYTKILELTNKNASVIIAPAWQGRVMTSTAEGDSGHSFGWINHQLIASGEIQSHINPFGGEERLWLGPEGGQYSIFFRKGKEFIYENWQTPGFIDTEPFELTALTDTSVFFTCETEIENYSGTLFKLGIGREVALLSAEQIEKQTGIDTKGLACVAYISVNTIFNKGEKSWTKESGLLSIWMLGMFIPSPSVVVVIPYRPGDDKDLGVPVNDNYFGKISADRLKVTGDHIFFRADGNSRGKIGIPPLRAKGIMGSYDHENNFLTLLFCKLPEGKTDYVNSAWEIQKNPYSGDAFNSYNDGPLEDGSQMGPFYELETSSPGAELKPGEHLDHIQITLHITGDVKRLDLISQKLLGVSLEEIVKAF